MRIRFNSEPNERYHPAPTRISTATRPRTPSSLGSWGNPPSPGDNGSSTTTDEAKVARDPSDCGDGYGPHGGDGNGWKLHVKAAVRNVCKGCVTCLVCKSTLCFKTHVCDCV